jgi:hypothetical protein
MEILKIEQDYQNSASCDLQCNTKLELLLFDEDEWSDLLGVKSMSFKSLPSQYPYKPDQLVGLKIAMRETEHPPRKRKPLDESDPSALYNLNSLGQNEGIPGLEGDVLIYLEGFVSLHQ